MSDKVKIGRLIALLVIGGLVILGGWLVGRQKDSQTPVNQDDNVENIPGLSTIPPTTAVPGQTSEPTSQPGFAEPGATMAPGETTLTNSDPSQPETEVTAASPATGDPRPISTVGVVAATSESLQGPITVNPSPTPNPTVGIIAPPPTPAGRLAPDTSAGPLLFQQTRIFMAEGTGRFTGRANIKNSGDSFLNGLRVSWRILGQAGQILDQGEISWPNLAPGETTTVPLEGTAVYDDSWVRVEFSYSP